MKKLLLILLCLPLFFISCREKKNKKENLKINFSKIIGKWEGKYIGNEKGTFIVYISDDGTVSGKTSFGSIINGRVKQNGNIKISTGEVNTGAIFIGNIKNNKFTGTWKNSRYNLSGTFIAKKSKNKMTKFENHKAVKNVKQKEKNFLYNQIKEDSNKKVLLEKDVNEQERITRDKFLIKKDNEDVTIIKKK